MTLTQYLQIIVRLGAVWVSFFTLKIVGNYGSLIKYYDISDFIYVIKIK